MKTTIQNNSPTSSALRTTPDDVQVHSESTIRAVPVTYLSDAQETYNAFDDGSLATVPMALEAYLDHQRCPTF